MLEIYDFDILTLSETWLNHLDDDKFLFIPGYALYRCDRVNTVNRGGGILIYIKLKFSGNVKMVDFNPYRVPGSTIEVMCLLIHSPLPTAIIDVYKPPAVNNTVISSDLKCLENFVIDVSLTTPHIVCLGDFNLNVLDQGNSGIKILDSFASFCHFEQLVKLPTRCTTVTNSLLDLIFVTPEIEVTDNGQIDTSNISDHTLVYCSLKLPEKKALCKYALRRSFRDLDDQLFSQAAELIPWERIFLMNDIDEKLSFLCDNMKSLFDTFAPLKRYKLTARKAPWISEPLKKLIKEKK